MAVSDLPVSERRLKQLERDVSASLLAVKHELLRKRKAGYQEKLLPHLLQDIRKQMQLATAE